MKTTSKLPMPVPGQNGPIPGPKLPDFAKQLACQHENLVFDDGAYVILCRNCQKTWIAMDAIGMPDVSQKASLIFVVDRCQQYRAPDPTPTPPAPPIVRPDQEKILQAALSLRNSQSAKEKPPAPRPPIALKRRDKSSK
jgi:hypothetical protein